MGNVYPPTETDFMDTCRDLIEAGAKLKNKIFTKSICGDRMDRYSAQSFFRASNAFVKLWDAYGSSFADVIKKADGNEYTYTLDYEDVRPLIYAKYDLASCLQFADGVYRGIDNGKMEEPDDVRDFRIHTQKKAFKDCPEEIPGLMEMVMVSSTNFQHSECGKLGLEKFKSVRRMNDLFPSTSRRELYQAVEKTISYLMEHLQELAKNGDSYAGKRIFVSAVNNIVDYCVYSMIAFAARIYAICQYIYPFTQTPMKVHAKESESIKESMEMPYEYPNWEDAIHMMRDADEGEMKSPMNVGAYIKLFKEFVNVTEATPRTKMPSHLDESRDYASYRYAFQDEEKQNPFCNALSTNLIYNGIDKLEYKIRDAVNAYSRIPDFREIENLFQDMMYNPQTAISGTNSPREEFLHVVRGIDAEHQTIAAYQTLAYDLFTLAMLTIPELFAGIHQIEQKIVEEKNVVPSTNTGALNALGNALRIMNYTYRELSWLYLQKARYIEAKLNYLRATSSDRKPFHALEVPVPNWKPDEPNANHTMMTAAPDTTPMPMSLMDLYALPIFEEAHYYEDILRCMPEFQDDLYLTESISDIFDAIIAAIQGAMRRFQNFWDDQSVQKSVKWTQEHANELQGLDFTGKTLQKITKFADPIQFGDIANHLIQGINKLDPSTACKNHDTAINSAKAIYPKAELYTMFQNKDGKIAARQYRHYLLFGNVDTNPNPIDPTVDLTGDALKQQVVAWIQTVSGSKQTFDGLNRLSTDLTNAINALKTKVVNLTNKEKEAQKKEAETAAGAADGKTTPPPKPATAPKGIQESDMSALMVEVQLIINRLWVPATVMFVDYIRTQYSYLKQCYGLGTRQNNT